MKKVITLVLIAAALAMSSASTHAGPIDWSQYHNYADTTVSSYTDSSFVETPNLNVNTWSSPTTQDVADQIKSYASDGQAGITGGYRQRAPSGGGAQNAFDQDLYYVSHKYSPNPSVAGFTRIASLIPGRTYAIAMYGIIGSNTKDVLSASADLGATWSAPIDMSVIDTLHGTTADWLEHSVTDVFGTANSTGVRDGDTRFRIHIGRQVADANGVVVAGFRNPELGPTGITSDRGRIDGFAVALVPEPSSIALTGLSLVGLLINRRKRSK